MELLLILLVVLLFFGGKKIPDLMRGLGRGVKEFNDARGKSSGDKEISGNKKQDSISEKVESNS